MILAPMQGLTELLFRHTYEECFPGAIRLAVAPFLSLTHNMVQPGGIDLTSAKYADVLPAANEGSIPITPQILGKEPEEFVALANALFDLGYQEVNWNIGCPMRAITGKHRGSGILPYPDEVHGILAAVIPRLHGQLGIKMRIGLKDNSEILALIPVLNDFPLASVTIHPRLGRQQYTGQCDLATYAAALESLHHPVVYNGDICTVADADRIRQRFPATADIMVGRGVLYNPSLPLELGGAILSPDQRHTNACRFIRSLCDSIHRHYRHSEVSMLHKTKEYWSLLWHSLHISEQVARTVLHAGCMEDVDKLILQMTQ